MYFVSQLLANIIMSLLTYSSVEQLASLKLYSVQFTPEGAHAGQRAKRCVVLDVQMRNS